MIDKQSLLEESEQQLQTPSEAPPAYDSVTNPASGDPGTRSYGDTKSSPLPPSGSLSSRSIPLSPSAARSPRLSSAQSTGPFQWLNFSSSRTAREVRTTVLGLVRDLVRQQNSTSVESRGILESCAEACSSHSLSFSSLLQEKSIEGHTPLYWAIIKRSSDSQAEDYVPDFLTSLLSYSSPLTATTRSDIRLACLLTSDQALFQRLRLSAEFSPLSGTDEILLGATLPLDGIAVHDLPGDEGAFAVDFEIVQFQKRMRISKSIVLEFIARSRLWRLSFGIATVQYPGSPRVGSWCVTLSLLETSPPTWIDSQLLISEPVRLPPSSNLTNANDNEAPATSVSPSGGFFSSRSEKPKPTISLRLKSQRRLSPAPRRHDTQTEIVVSLEDSVMAASLQYAGSSYIAPDETLRARLEARLAKTEHDGECVIC